MIPYNCGFFSDSSSQDRTSVEMSFANIVNVIANEDSVQHGESSGSLKDTVRNTGNKDGKQPQ